MKIRKRKIKNPSFRERLKKKASKEFKIGIEYKFTFGIHKGERLENVILTNHKYVRHLLDTNVFILDVVAIALLLRVEHVEENRRKAQQREDQKRRDRQERCESRYEDSFRYAGYSGFDDFINEAFRNQRQRNSYGEQRQQTHTYTQSASVNEEQLHPAYRFDHLPARVKYGKILRLEGSVTKEEIRSQYRKLALLFHPDKNGQLDTIMQETAKIMFIRIQEAYDYFKKEYAL